MSALTWALGLASVVLFVVAIVRAHKAAQKERRERRARARALARETLIEIGFLDGTVGETDD